MPSSRHIEQILGKSLAQNKVIFDYRSSARLRATDHDDPSRKMEAKRFVVSELVSVIWKNHYYRETEFLKIPVKIFQTKSIFDVVKLKEINGLKD